MIKYIVLVVVTFFFLSCSTHQPVKPYEKAFTQEDQYILFALWAEKTGDYSTSSKLFNDLYEKSAKEEYLYRSLQSDLKAQEYEKLLHRVDILLEDTPNNPKLLRYKILVNIALDDLDSALLLSTRLASQTKNANDYLLASEIYVKRQEFGMAVKYLESAYTKGYNEKLLDKMSIVLYVNLNRKKDAIAHLETHSRIFGCSQLICQRLIAFYSNDNNINGLLSTYLRLYSVQQDEKVAKKIVQIYTYKHDYIGLMNFLEKHTIDDALLLQIYSSLKNYKKAYQLADKLYKKTAEIEYLGQNAIFEYESAADKKSKELLQRVVKKLTKVVDINKKALYLNYLGYILIDHNINVKKGMDYIYKVLKKQPETSFYLDSLAWGYYKLGECNKAKKIMDKVVHLDGGDNPEVISHIRKIKKCLKN